MFAARYADQLQLKRFAQSPRARLFIGAAEFSAAGQLQVTTTDASNTLIRGDINGDGTADLTIKLAGNPGLGASSFVL